MSVRSLQKGTFLYDCDLTLWVSFAAVHECLNGSIFVLNVLRFDKILEFSLIQMEEILKSEIFHLLIRFNSIVSTSVTKK